MDKSKAIEAALVEGLLASSTGRSVDAETVEQSLLASGWAIVPVEAAPHQIHSGIIAHHDTESAGWTQDVEYDKMNAAYRAMIAAASKERTTNDTTSD